MAGKSSKETHFHALEPPPGLLSLEWEKCSALCDATRGLSPWLSAVVSKGALIPLTRFDTSEC